MNKKKLLSLALVVLLIATISFGTLAWFNDQEEVTNIFHVASSEDTDPDSIFSVDVYENVDTDGNGETERVDTDGTEFKDILPGENIIKAPYVQNTGRYPQWVRLTITFASQDDWYTVFNAHTDTSKRNPLALLNFADDFNDCWVGESYTATGDAYVYVYYSRDPLPSEDTLPTFTSVTIPHMLTQEDMFDIKNLTLKVKAEAIQTENLGDGVKTAKDAFKVVDDSIANS